MPATILWNRTPLPSVPFAPLAPSAIRPKGALQDDISKETPKNIDGLLLRACMLEDEPAIEAFGRQLTALMQKAAEPDDAQMRALMRYHALTADKEVALYFLRQAQRLRDGIRAGERLSVRERSSIGQWLQVLLWLYNMTGQTGLLELCKMLKAQSPDWMSTFHTFSETRPVSAPPPKDTDAYWRLHGGTVAASLKTPALQALFEGGLKNETAFEAGWSKLMRFHGAAHGLFNADPLLAGGNPAAFMAPEVVWEMLHTLQALLWAQGKVSHADLMERIYYGPLRFASSRQAANQISAAREPSPEGSALYASSLWMASADDGLAMMGFEPCEVRWRLSGRLVRIATETAYPDEEAITLRIQTREPADFPLWLRIPAWAEGAHWEMGDGGERKDCEAGTFERIARTWRDGDVLRLVLPMRVVLNKGYHQSVSLLRGPECYGLDLSGGEAWNQALLVEKGFGYCAKSGIPSVHVWLAEVPGWNRMKDMPVSPPVKEESAHQATLLPYRLLAARMTQFPAAAHAT